MTAAEHLAVQMVLPVVWGMVDLRQPSRGQRACVVCEKPFAICRNTKTCSPACSQALRIDTITACNRGKSSKYVRLTPRSHEPRTCSECGQTQEASAFRRRSGRLCRTCHRFRRYVASCRLKGRASLPRAEWEVQSVRVIGRKQLPAPAKGQARCPRCLTVYASATVKRRAYCPPCRTMVEGRTRRDEWKVAKAAQREERRAARAASPQRVRRLAIIAARQAWIDWLGRAPSWWLASYEETIRATHREKYHRRYWSNPQAERERIRRYQRTHVGKKQEWYARRIELESALSDGTLTSSTFRRVLQSRTDCPYCQRSLDVYGRSLDHIEPISRGGLHSIRNVTVCCRTCNFSKGSKPFARWLQSLTLSGQASARLMLDGVAGCVSV